MVNVSMTLEGISADDRRALAYAIEKEMGLVEFGQVVQLRPNLTTGPVTPLGVVVTESLEVPTDSTVTPAVVEEALRAAQVAGEVPAGTALWPKHDASIYEPAEYVGGALAADLALESGLFSLAYLLPEEPDEYGEQEPFAWVILKLSYTV